MTPPYFHPLTGGPEPRGEEAAHRGAQAGQAAAAEHQQGIATLRVACLWYGSVSQNLEIWTQCDQIFNGTVHRFDMGVHETVSSPEMQFKFVWWKTNPDSSYLARNPFLARKYRYVFALFWYLWPLRSILCSNGAVKPTLIVTSEPFWTRCYTMKSNVASSNRDRKNKKINALSKPYFFSWRRVPWTKIRRIWICFAMINFLSLTVLK